MVHNHVRLCCRVFANMHGYEPASTCREALTICAVLCGVGSDLVMDSRGWTSSVVGNISKWINLDSGCQRGRLAAEKVFKQEVAWASHLSVPAVLLPPPRHHTNSSNYARVLNQSVTQAQYMQVIGKAQTV